MMKSPDSGQAATSSTPSTSSAAWHKSRSSLGDIASPSSSPSISLFNQLSGINAILYYSNYIFAAAGFSNLSGSPDRHHRPRQPGRTFLGIPD
jgi:hypothetical protein